MADVYDYRREIINNPVYKGPTFVLGGVHELSEEVEERVTGYIDQQKRFKKAELIYNISTFFQNMYKRFNNK